MPAFDFMQQRRGFLHAEMEQKRGKFFPFLDKFQQQRDPVTATESLGTVVDSGTGFTLKYSSDRGSGSEAEQVDTTVEDTGFPTVIAEFAFHNDFNEARHAPTGFTDVTQFVRSVSGKLRGRSYEVGRFESGSITVGLDNNDGRFTPGSKRSPYYPDIKANRRFRLRGKNMQNPNIATGGGAYGNTIGFRKGTGAFASDWAGTPYLASHSLFYLPPGIGTSHIEFKLFYEAPVGTHDLIEFYAPIELGSRLAHSAYVWKVSGNEAPDSLKHLIAVYYDADGNELTPINTHSYKYSWTDTTWSTPTRVYFADQPPAEAKYCLIRFRITHNSMKNVYNDVVYAITGIQTEVPENNYAPLMDSLNFSLEGDGNVYEDGEEGIVASWGPETAGAVFRVPRMIPGETYTFAATVKKTGPDLIMTADEGQSGAMLDNDDAEIEVSASFVANRPEEEIRFLAADPNIRVASNLALNKTATGTATCKATETADKAVNGSWTGGLSDKFCSGVSPGLLTVDLGEMRDVQGFIVRHARAGGETANYNTKDFNIYTSDDNVVFTQVVAVTGNTDDTTIHVVACRGRYFKLEVTTATQIGDIATRIYEFEIYDAVGIMPETSGTVLNVKNLTVRKGDVTDLDLYPPLTAGSLASAEEKGITEWEAPKPIFEGWSEDWPAVAHDHTSTIEVTINDRAARLGSIELSHTLREALFQDDPQLVVAFDDDPIDSQGQVSNLGSWSATNGMTTLVISPMNGDMTGASYVQGIEGPTSDNATQFNRLNASGRGYVVVVPYTPQFVTKLPPPSAPPGPLPNKAEGAVISKNYYATWQRVFTKTGALKAADSNPFPYLYQGDCTDGDASCSGDGDLRSLVGFNFAGIMKDLEGAHIRYVGLSIHAVSWWYFTGGYGVFGTHDYTDRGGPQTWSASRVEVARWRTGLFRRDSWQTISLGVDVGYELQAGTTTGLSVGPALSSSLNYYGYFDGVKHRYKPYFTIQYTK